MKTVNSYQFLARLITQVLLCGALPLLQSSVHAQQGFIHQYPLVDDLFSIYDILPLKNGDLILSGSQGEYHAHCRNIRVDQFGNSQWEAGIQILSFDYKWQTVNLGDSLFFEGGMTSVIPQYGSDPFIHCFDAKGNTRWTKQFGVYQFDQFKDLVVNNQGLLFAVGPYDDSLSNQQTFILHFDIHGDVIWRREYKERISLSTFGITALRNGNLLMSSSNNEVPHFTTLDTAGNIVSDRAFPEWRFTYPFIETKVSNVENILCLGSGGVFREFNSNGDLLRTYPDSASITGVLPAMDGGVILHGVRSDGSDFYIRKLNADWSINWEKIYTLSKTNVIFQIVELPNGDLLMGGYQGNGQDDPMVGLLIRTDCEGNIEDYHPCLAPQVNYTLWPNPNNGMGNLAIPEPWAQQPHTVQVYNALGQRVLETSIQNHAFVPLGLQQVEQGVYFLRVMRDGKAVWHSRWVVQR
jgi:hypothetical protein